MSPKPSVLRILFVFLPSILVSAHPSASPASDPTVVLRLEHPGADSVAFSPDGNLLATGGSVDFPGPGNIKVWDAHTGKLRHEEKFEYGVTSVAFSPDGKRLADASNGKIRMRDTLTWKHKQTLPGGWLTARVAFSPDGRYVAGGSGMAEEGSVDHAYLWNARTDKLSRTLPKSEGTSDPVFSPDSKTLAGIDWNGGDVSFWDVRSGKLKSRHRHPSAWCLAMSPDGKTLATGSYNGDQGARGVGDIRLWDVRTGQWIRTFQHDCGICAIAYSPDGALRASGDAKGLLRLSDAKTGKVMREWQAPIPKPAPSGDTIKGLRFAPNGKSLACVIEDKVIVWAVK